MLRSVGALIFGTVADRYGRKWVMIFNLVLFIILELATGFTNDQTSFLAVRALYGIAMGGTRCIVSYDHKDEANDWHQDCSGLPPRLRSKTCPTRLGGCSRDSSNKVTPSDICWLHSSTEHWSPPRAMAGEACSGLVLAHLCSSSYTDSCFPRRIISPSISLSAKHS